MEKREAQELSEIIQSSKINFLIGSGISRPFLPVLNDIEKDLNETTDEKERIELYKKYLKDVMLPNRKVLDGTLGDSEVDFDLTIDAYENFFKMLTSLLLQRKSTILSKQINLFTTNIDILMEKVLEKLNLEYNDGFSGRFTPSFGLANFKRSINQRSLHFDHISEIPVFNIIKIHGSLTWRLNDKKDKILFSDKLENVSEETLELEGDNFYEEYNKIQVVNPEKAKHLESVLNVYYSELLRLFSSELEKENALLFSIGFSMADEHIRQITLRAAKSNPTLRIFVCCSQGSQQDMENRMEVNQYPNIKVLTPENISDKYTLEYFSKLIENNVLKGKDE